MRYLVTGGTGFLGGHLVSALQARGCEVVAMGRDQVKCHALEESGVRTIRCDLGDAAAVSAGLAGIDVVFHAAALSSPWGTYRDFYASNVKATENLVQAALHNGVRRLVHVSSPSVTSDGRDKVNEDESHPYARRFLSPYQQTKKLAEDVVNQLREKMEYVILRPKAIFGPGDNALMPRLISAARSGRLRQIGDGTNRVDLTYVGNVVDAMLLGAESDCAVGRTYIITNGEHVVLWPMIRRVLALAGCKEKLGAVPWRFAYGAAAMLEWKAQWTHVEPALTRYSVSVLARTQTYSIEAARRDLLYSPRVTVDQAVELMVPWLNQLTAAS